MLLSDRRPPRRTPSQPSAVLDDPGVLGSAAFLNGTLTAHLRSQSRPVPPWALLNQVAYGTIDDLRSAAAGGGGSPTEISLAKAVLARVTDPAGLSQLQRTILVPLERSLSDQIVSPRRVLELATKELFRV